jgi:cytochrome c peroxidase
MHTGSLTLRQVLEHYNSRTALNANLDPRLRPEGRAKDLRMNAQEFDDMMAFMRTLSGARLYSDPKWSDPFIR